MGRTLKILAYAVILFLTYLVITAALKSCNNNTKDVASAEMDQSDSFEEVYEDDEFFEEGSDDGSSDDDFFGPVTENEKVDYDEIDAALEKSSKRETVQPEIEPDYTTPSKTTNHSTPPKKNYDDSGMVQYMAIAGSYIINSNAESMVTKLKKLGYADSEVVVFDQSQYYTVIAGRSSSYDGALRVSNKLKTNGIDSYVHKKK